MAHPPTTTWLDQVLPSRPDLQRLVDGHDYREALEWVKANEADPEAERSIAESATLHWLHEAEVACRANDRARMNACMAEAARFHEPQFAVHFRETRRRIQTISLCLTSAPHWVELLQAALHQRQRYFMTDEAEVPSSYGTFSQPKLPLGIVDFDSLEGFDATVVRKHIQMGYPTELGQRLSELDEDFLMAAARVAGGRPDLAVIHLVSGDRNHPLVCLERARVAHALGFPTTSVLALSDFQRSHGEHVSIRRLHTGVFMAQMAWAGGDPERAIDILTPLPLDSVGRRPILFLAKMQKTVGRLAESAATLDAWLFEHPDDHEAAALRELTT